MSPFIQRLRQETRARPALASPWLDLASGALGPASALNTLRAICALRLGDPGLAVVRFLVAAQELPGRRESLRRGVAQAMERAGLAEAALEQWLALAMEDPRQALPLEQAARLLDALDLAALPCGQRLLGAQLPHLRARHRQPLRRAVRALRQAPGTTVLGAVWLEDDALAGWVLDCARPARRVEVSLQIDGRPGPRTLAEAGFPVGRAFRIEVPSRPNAPGSVIDVFADNSVRLAGAPFRLGPAPPAWTARPPEAPSPRPGHGGGAAVEADRDRVDVIVPIHRDRDAVARCLETLRTSRAHNRARWRLVLVNDASPEPGMGPWLRALARQDEAIYLETPRNLGFVGAINLALPVCRGRDLVWLNADTQVAGDWLDRLRAAARSAPEVASVTPLSNNAQLFSYPRPMRDNPMPDVQGTAELQRLAAAANAGCWVTVPTGVGFCLYLKAAAVAAAGRLDERAYLLGYAEEIDYCLRLSRAGWRHLCAADVYVAHRGAVSFQFAKARLAKENDQVLRERYPVERAAIGTFRRQDPLAEARGRLERLWLAERPAWDGLFLCSATAANRYCTYDLLRRRQGSGRRDLQLRCLDDGGGLVARLEGALDAPPRNLGFRLPAQRMELARELLALRINDRLTVLHDRAFPPLLFELLAAMPRHFELIRLDASLEESSARLPDNHLPCAHTRYRRARWARLAGRRDLPPPLALDADLSGPPARPAAGASWVAVMGHGAAAADQRRLLALARLAQTRIRWLALGAVLDPPALVSTGRCECLGAPAPADLLDVLSWSNCQAVLNPSDRPGPDPSAFLVSRRLGVPYIGARAADGLAYLSAPRTLGFNRRAAPEALLETVRMALAETAPA